MIIGIALLVVGYSVFYWGMHHFNADPTQSNTAWPRYNLWCVLGLGALLGNTNKPGLPPLSPFQWQTPAIPPQSDQAEQGTGPSPSGAPGITPSNTSPAPLQQTGSAPQNWTGSILQAIGAPANQPNKAKLVAWNAAEGNDKGKSGLPINNPFNTTCDCCGGTPVPGNSAGVRSYPSWGAGVQATANTLTEARYTAILNNLTNSGSYQSFANAVGSSPWGTNGNTIYAYLLYLGGQGTGG